MGILDSLSNEKQNSNNRQNNQRTNREDLPKAKLWLNIGYEVNGKFINLPVGIPVDTMEPLPVRGQNEEWVKIQTARNGLLKALIEAGSHLQPGEEKDVNLTIRLRRTSEEMVVANADNEFSADLSNLLG